MLSLIFLRKFGLVGRIMHNIYKVWGLYAKFNLSRTEWIDKDIFFISRFKFKLEHVLEICWSETKIRLLNLIH